MELAGFGLAGRPTANMPEDVTSCMELAIREDDCGCCCGCGCCDLGAGKEALNCAVGFHPTEPGSSVVISLMTPVMTELALEGITCRGGRLLSRLVFS